MGEQYGVSILTVWENMSRRSLISSWRITKKIVDCIVDNIVNCKKHFMKVALVGVHKKYHNMFYAIREEGTLMTFLDDYEKAKEWVFLRG